ncbi:precorrin-6A/cobalt-precorrin-6A reductase [Prochlorococcus marinus]|uniref:precorrin-6A/cobalt-precorrin-6A reductase n=1 Tax=Prochlorococcus marinus TaxID=1219 RepID=UPI0039AF605F
MRKTNFAVLNPSVSSNGKIEKALVKKWDIDGVICRQSGGRNELLWHRICISMNIKLWLLKRPCELKHINSIDNYETLIKRLKSINME